MQYLLLRGHGDDGEWTESDGWRGVGMVKDVAESGNGEAFGKVRGNTSGGGGRR